MNALHRAKTVYTDRNIPHFVQEGEEPTHRYLSGQKWRYMAARSHEDFLKWSAGWMDASHKPQRKVAGIWRDL